MAGNFVQSSEHYLSQIDAEIERLQSLRVQVTGAIQGDKAVDAPKGRRGGMSAEGRRRVAEAQKARWAKLKKDSEKQKPALKKARKSAAKKALAEG